MLTFSDRIKHRSRIWWGGASSASSWKRPLHRYLDRWVLRSRSWPMDRWRCCAHWQRSLNNKWNAREFAAMHGIKVPELYWFGRRLSSAPIDAFPEHFVLKPIWGAAGKKTFVVTAGRDLLGSRQYASRHELRSAILKQCGRFTRVPFLVEEFMTTPRGEYAQGMELKFYVFGGEVAAIRSIQIQGHTSRARYYDPEWTPFMDPFNTLRAILETAPRPDCLDELIGLSQKLGKSFETFMRVDYYITANGCYFGEFSSTPLNGNGYTPFANAYLGRFWNEYISDKV